MFRHPLYVWMPHMFHVPHMFGHPHILDASIWMQNMGIQTYRGDYKHMGVSKYTGGV